MASLPLTIAAIGGLQLAPPPRAFDALSFLLLRARPVLQQVVDLPEPPPFLGGVSWSYIDETDMLRLRARFPPPHEDWYWEIDRRQLTESGGGCGECLANGDFSGACGALYRSLLAARADDTRVIRRYQGIDFAAAPNMMAPEVNAAQERLAREMNEWLIASAFATVAPEPSQNTLTMESFRRAVRMMREMDVPDCAVMRQQRQLETMIRAEMEAQGFLRDFGAFGTATFVTSLRSDAIARGLALLKEWLSPAQREQYEDAGCFDVTGNVSGNRYRIKQGSSMNVEQIDGEGRPVCGWCFVPEGGLVAGDVMLAQKVALETDEAAAMKVARPFVPTGLYMRPGAVNYLAAANSGPNWFERLFQLGS